MVIHMAGCALARYSRENIVYMPSGTLGVLACTEQALSISLYSYSDAM
jgi:hypothetical protein